MGGHVQNRFVSPNASSVRRTVGQIFVSGLTNDWRVKNEIKINLIDLIDFKSEAYGWKGGLNPTVRHFPFIRTDHSLRVRSLL